ncbi:hypothetical protein DPMN_038192 [Dreissena polymorpha]|uniref:Uncharacterized protein n=1 Tax=Dreissena polymorpha TaxID=45954 RepID=A0A9D4RQG6_DREPO|nr:hypothetical protein DPMN_038192 [Dreissena polymorpha]
MVLSDDIACMPDIIHAPALMGGLRNIHETEHSNPQHGNGSVRLYLVIPICRHSWK